MYAEIAVHADAADIGQRVAQGGAVLGFDQCFVHYADAERSFVQGQQHFNCGIVMRYF